MQRNTATRAALSSYCRAGPIAKVEKTLDAAAGVASDWLAAAGGRADLDGDAGVNEGRTDGELAGWGGKCV